MIYVDSTFYDELYANDAIDDDAFSRLSRDASKRMDRLTTGVDGVKKLTAAYPTDEDDIEAVKRCGAALIHTMLQIEQMEQEQMEAARIVKQTDGTYQSALVSSRSAGNESVSYASAGSLSKSSVIAAAVADPLSREKLYRDTVTQYLSGVHDANGVNVLYMGRYPHV